MSRSSWKGLVGTSETSRNHLVLPSEIGKEVVIHNGKGLFEIKINKYMLNNKLGTLGYTKKICIFRSKKGKKKKK